jgi:hypothetical protein
MGSPEVGQFLVWGHDSIMTRTTIRIGAISGDAGYSGVAGDAGCCWRPLSYSDPWTGPG